MKFKLIIFFAFFFNTLLWSQKYYVNTEKLNVRRQPNKDSKIIAQLKKNAEISILSENNDWVKVNINNQEGYVNKKYLSTVTIQGKKKFSFKEKFQESFFYSYLILGFLYWLYDSYKNKTIKDARYTKGYKILEYNLFDFMKYCIFPLPLAAIIGVIIATFKSLINLIS